MKLSVSVGDLAHGHDTDAEYRSKLPNVDPSRTARNAVLRNESVEAFYARRFGPAVEAYNARQRAAGRPGRCVGDYLEKVRAEYARDREAVREGRKRRSQKPAEAYEYVVQVGDARSHPDEATSKAVLGEWLDEMEGRCPGMEVAWAAIHLDEATPHLHVAMVPVGEGTRGIGTTVSWNGALKRCGVRSKVELLAAMKDTLRERCAAHGIEVEPDGPGGRAHVTVEEYKRQMRAAEKAARDAKQARDDATRATQAKNEAERKAKQAREDAKKAAWGAKKAQEAQSKAEADEAAAKARLESLKRQVAIVEGDEKWVDPKTHESHMGLSQVKAEVAAAEADLSLKRAELNRVTKKVADKRAELEKVRNEVKEKRTTLETLTAAVELARNQLATIFAGMQQRLLAWWREEPWRAEHNQDYIDAAVEQERQKWVPSDKERGYDEWER